MKFKKTIIISISASLIIIASLLYIANVNSQSIYKFETAKVKIGSISNTITATGTLEATNTVVVGTQVSGDIEKIYVDFNSKVKKGQLIAELDKSTLQSNFETTEAELASAEANLEYQKSSFERNKKLFEKQMISESDYDLSKYNFKKAKASLKSANANLNRAKHNFEYAMIYAPISGIVMNRNVEEGQTVAASMNTPELFTIANDLTEMQVEANIDEADIGQVKEGQRVEFTVDAFPDENFQGHISQVRLQPNESANVITYTVIVSVKNEALKLKPGMTASITDYVQEINDVLVVSGKAIRFTPQREVVEKYLSTLTECDEREVQNYDVKPPYLDYGQNPPPLPKELKENMKMVWIKNGELIRPTMIETGMTDGLNIEIISGLTEGDEIVISMEKLNSKSIKNDEEGESQKSPFVPEGPGQGGPPPGGPR